MTSNDTSVPAGSGGRRRVLGRGPGATPVPTEERDGRPEERVEPAEEPTVDGRAESVEEPVEEPVEAATETAPELPADTAPEPPAGDPPADTALESSTAGPPADTALEPSAGPPAQAEAGDGVFKVRLANFEGPFDLLLQLISKHKLDVTEVALSKVTDEFMAHIRAMGPDWDLDQTTEFLVVAATLLDLKAARLLPAAEVEDEADLALLEARDLLFARLLQYRAYKQIADIFNARLEEEGRRYPRTVGLEAHHAELLPEVVISIGAEGFARLAVKAMQPKPKPQVYVDHIHAPLVSVQEQAGIVVARLRELGEASFRALVEDTQDTLTVVARFLALLELYREKAVALDQEEALGELMVRWTGGDGDGQPRVTDEFDRPPEVAKDDRAKDGDTKDDKIKDGAKEEKA
ncbi:segregation/condensation protein A [Streptomyces sp. RLB3-17]|uniref:segregation and condensation protein A n=1 Tax=Streptomyces TaxID=1883 RepID=UPI000BCF68E6|nr:MULTISPECIES: segregation/condensation protein A [unclassified Streptomyces]QDN97474.1 segregation/condensation protein A [Streptomyces sp. RLB1-9]QDO19180.1 segregation/condensation protein A [Streptomyces sp. S1A1-8]QDO29307.1 segregation/condensation protein A [Streptomyces sp. S1A1-3]QDO39209.1 segregation/condensation protein A [Streptomyces sp. RLB3-17]SOE26659.1 condensin subunit ScpA [Streptomyces sp. OK228]